MKSSAAMARVTAFFLDWLLLARGRGRHGFHPVKLAALSGVVKEIAAEPSSSLTPKLLQDLPNALAACQCAITLREHVSTFFASGRGETLLKDWHATLKTVTTQQETGTDSTRFENYYAVLEVDEDYFPNEGSLLLRLEPQGTQGKAAVKYPALKTAEDVAVIVMENAPKDYMKKWRMQSRISGPNSRIMGRTSSSQCGEHVGELHVCYPTRARTKLVLRDGFFGETYGEERTPQYVPPDPSNMQLPLLYNTILATKVATGTGYDISGLASSFMASMDEYFTTRKVTVSIVFTCICWLKSVAALQGNSGLTRNVSLTFKHSKDLMRNMEATVEKGAVFTADKEIHGLLKKCAEEIKQSSRSHNLARANPLMAGFMMLTYHFHYSHMTSEILMVTSRFRAFGLLYNALVEQRFLQHIPFFHEVLRIYDEMIFTPSRASAVHGSYNCAYLLSSHLTPTSVNAMYRGVTPPAGKEGIKVWEDLHFKDLSKIYRLLTENDKSVLGGASSKAMLNKAADICSMELFQTRVLSRDILKLNDDLT
ncbi:hypothetical protein GQ600_2034 [Phytophthora cactorum]|nr:hypothetical protein GQ600_2034 [Phytophthora cactorum]